MRVSRRGGIIKLSLDEVEVAVLGRMLDELDGLIDAMDSEDGSTRRLFPSANREDDEIASEFRALTEQGLRDTRKVRYGVLRAALPPAGGTIELAQEQHVAWLASLNDLRLALGTRLGVTEDEPEFDPAGEEAQSWALYYWLTALQDSLVNAAMK